jgi:hypothetical protein
MAIRRHSVPFIAALQPFRARTTPRGYLRDEGGWSPTAAHEEGLAMGGNDALLSFGNYFTWGIGLIAAVLIIAGMWMMFEKAGRPGWGAIIPFYNAYLLIKVAGHSGWWLIAFFVPFVNFFVGLWILYGLSKAYGHGFLMWLGFVFFAWIFFPVVGFGGSQYQLAKHESSHSTSGAMPTPA